MSEIEKLYARAMIKPLSITVRGVDEQIINYQPFTPEKQLELIKLLSNNDKDKNKKMCIYNSSHPYFYFGLYHNEDIEDNSYGYGESLTLTFEEGIANLINNLWQDLTESEQEQIRSILNG